MKAARKTHEVVQKVSSHVESFAKSGTLPSSSSSSSSTSVKSIKSQAQRPDVPLHHEELTESDHMRGRGVSNVDIMGKLRQAKEQVKSDAAADWEDIKAKFRFGK